MTDTELREAPVDVRVGILQADAVRPELIATHGDYPAMFDGLLQTAAAQTGVSVRLTTYNVEHGELPPTADACDGYLITGSRHSVYDPLPWIASLVQFVGDLRDRQIPLVGVCFGHQLVAHFFGGRVARAEGGWAVGVHRSRITGQRAWMVPPLDSVGLLSSHQDQVQALPDDAEPYASNAFCPHAGFTVGNHTMTIQGHPEFCKPYARALLGVRRGILGEPIYQGGVDSLTQPTESEVMAQWMLRFFAARGR